MHYVFLDDNYQTGHILMSDIENMDDVTVVYKDSLFKLKPLNFLGRLTISQRTKKLASKKIKDYIFKKIFSNIMALHSQVCVVMISAWYDPQLLSWLRNNIEKIKLVLILRDTVNSNEKRNPEFRIQEIKKQFDLVMSYDRFFDVVEYDLQYAPVYMSKLNDLRISDEPLYDVGYIALVKDRLSIIHQLYKKMSRVGIKSYFYLLGVAHNDRIKFSNIIYSNRTMNRIECLEKELNANCILEILKGDAHSNTLRYWEAIIYNRKFLTNWPGVKDSKYYNPEYIQYFDDIDSINIDFIKERSKVDYHYDNELSPINLFDLINKELF